MSKTNEAGGREAGGRDAGGRTKQGDVEGVSVNATLLQFVGVKLHFLWDQTTSVQICEPGRLCLISGPKRQSGQPILP